MKKLSLLLLASLFSFSAFADSSTTIYECISASPSVTGAILDETGTQDEKGNVLWTYTFIMDTYNQATDTEGRTKVSAPTSRDRLFEPGKKGYAVFGDLSSATHGIVPNGMIIGKSDKEQLDVGINGGVLTLHCVAKTQADY